jgi:hypothetical protein
MTTCRHSLRFLGFPGFPYHAPFRPTSINEALMGEIDQSSVACQEEAKLSEGISGDKGQGLGQKGLHQDNPTAPLMRRLTQESNSMG